IVRALVFDVFGTLVDWRSTITQAFRESGLPADPEELADEWRARLWPVLAEVNEGKRPWGNFDDLHLATLDDLLAERGLELAPQARRELIDAWHHLDPWPDVREGLEALRREHVVAALSNGHVSLLIDLARHADLRFDCLLSAEMARVYKPAAEVYITGVRVLGMQPDEVMMVAAHPFDLKGARRVGLQTAFIDRPLEHGPGSPAREDPDADVAVGELHELATRLVG
ncbi:MAG TPA: haloacid dehalogenase type II, partial [Solirubrobacteraceae bacterium]|nr:haloacid dehalogenase type II [Solirubrobacteraceae bacterium]